MSDEINEEVQKQIHNIYHTGFVEGGDAAFDAVKKVFIQVGSDNNKDSFSTKEIIDLIDLSKDAYKQMMVMKNKIEDPDSDMKK